MAGSSRYRLSPVDRLPSRVSGEWAREKLHYLGRSSSVSLPEVALLSVLPGTGGLTRLVDKRRVRRDRADVFCTTPDGVRGQRAVEWRLAHRFPLNAIQCPPLRSSRAVPDARS